MKHFISLSNRGFIRIWDDHKRSASWDCAMVRKHIDHKQIAINKFTIKDKVRHPGICISAVFLIHHNNKSINKRWFINKPKNTFSWFIAGQKWYMFMSSPLPGLTGKYRRKKIAFSLGVLVWTALILAGDVYPGKLVTLIPVISKSPNYLQFLMNSILK